MDEKQKTNEGIEPFIPPKKKGKKVLIIIILLLIALGIGLYFGYKRLTSNPLSVYKKMINETYELANNFLEENIKDSMDFNLAKDPLTINSSFTLDTNLEELNMLKNYEYSLSIGTDISKEQLNISLGLNEENENIINLLFAFLNDNMYLKSDDLYEEVINFGESGLDFSELQDEDVYFSYDDLSVVLTKTKTILINSLDSNKFITDEETINLNGKSIKAQKFTYLLDQENMERTIKYIRDEVLKDEELMSAISRITGITTAELKEVLNEDIDYSDYETMYINLYTNGGSKVIAGNILVSEKEVLNFNNQDDVFTLSIKDEYTRIDIVSKNGEINIVYLEDDEEILDMSINIKDNKEIIKFTLNDGADEIKATIELTNIKKSKLSESADFKISASMNSYNEEISLELKGNLEVTKAELEEITIRDAIDIDSMTYEETEILYENLMNIVERLDLLDYLEL